MSWQTIAQGTDSDKQVCYEVDCNGERAYRVRLTPASIGSNFDPFSGELEGLTEVIEKVRLVVMRHAQQRGSESKQHA